MILLWSTFLFGIGRSIYHTWSNFPHSWMVYRWGPYHSGGCANYRRKIHPRTSWGLKSSSKEWRKNPLANNHLAFLFLYWHVPRSHTRLRIITTNATPEWAAGSHSDWVSRHQTTSLVLCAHFMCATRQSFVLYRMSIGTLNIYCTYIANVVRIIAVLLRVKKYDLRRLPGACYSHSNTFLNLSFNICSWSEYVFLTAI